MSIVNLPRDDITVQDLKHANANRDAIRPLTQSAALKNSVNSATRQQAPPQQQTRPKIDRRTSEDRRRQDRREQSEETLLDTRSSQERRRSDRRREKLDLKESVKDFNFTSRGIDITV